MAYATRNPAHLTAASTDANFWDPRERESCIFYLSLAHTLTTRCGCSSAVAGGPFLVHRPSGLVYLSDEYAEDKVRLLDAYKCCCDHSLTRSETSRILSYKL